MIKHHEKRNIVLEYIRNDLLQCHDIRIILNLLTHSNCKIIETSLRLLNVMASFATGRGYLLKTDHTALINALSHILTGTTSDDPMRMNSLGCLQKLSLRRELQDVMIEKGLIGWIIEMLHSELDELSEYTVEYSTAMLMNLTLRTKGKKQCQLNDQHIPKILNTLLKLLMSSFVVQIHTYVNGVLYSLLSEKVIREAAIKMRLTEKLSGCIAKYNEESFKQQIDYIVTQLSSPSKDLLEDDEDSDDASNEDYSENEDYEEFDVNELAEYLKEQQIGNTVQVQGDEYLRNEFQRNADEHHLKPNMQPIQKRRPVTPQMTKKIRLNDAKTKRVPKFTSFVPVENEKEDAVSKSKNDKWMKDEDYRVAFGSKPQVPRTPPRRLMKRTSM